MGVEALSKQNQQYQNVYQNQNEFNNYFLSTFDKYDRNRDGKLDRNEFQPLVNEMCQKVQQQYGSGPTLDKIRQAWMSLDKDQSGYITRCGTRLNGMEFKMRSGWASLLLWVLSCMSSYTGSLGWWLPDSRSNISLLALWQVLFTATSTSR